MADEYYCSQADLELAVGGAALLVQLSDPGKTGQAQPSIVANYLMGGAAEIRTAVEVKHDPEVIANLDEPSLRRLIDANAALSARIAYEKGGKGMAMPDYVEKAAERADRFLDQLGKGERRLGRVAGSTAAAVSQATGIGLVDYDKTATAALDPSKAAGVSIAGFKRGFR